MRTARFFAMILGAAAAAWFASVPSVARASIPVTAWHVPVLMYHRIAPNSDLRNSIRDLVVKPRVFEAQMKKLHDHGWHTITAVQLVEAMQARTVVPDKTFILSFDDGTQDVYRNAWPIMVRYGFVGTFYLITRHTQEVNRPASYYMSQSQARALYAGGNEIADHSRDHTCMSSGTSYKTDYYEINRAARDIRRFIGLRPVTLAWPKGCYDAVAIKAARDAHMYLAFSTAWGARETTRNRLRAPRIRVGRSTTPRELYQTLVRLQNPFLVMPAPGKPRGPFPDLDVTPKPREHQRGYARPPLRRTVSHVGLIRLEWG